MHVCVHIPYKQLPKRGESVANRSRLRVRMHEVTCRQDSAWISRINDSLFLLKNPYPCQHSDTVSVSRFVKHKYTKSSRKLLQNLMPCKLTQRSSERVGLHSCKREVGLERCCKICLPSGMKGTNKSWSWINSHALNRINMNIEQNYSWSVTCR